MVQIRNLQKKYGSFPVLCGLDMNIEKGDVYGFLGKNGCGKTTTMNILCNTIGKDGGDVFLGENGIEEKIKIGYLPETPSLYGYMNGYEYLRYIAACCKYKGNVEERVNEVLSIVGMLEGGKRRIGGYSRGMNQRLGIAATIFDNPELIVLDEPTSALDPEGRAEVMNIIQALANTGATIILCTHILSDVERVANKIGILKNGKIVLEGKINQIMNFNSRREIEMKLFETTATAVESIKTLSDGAVIENVEFYDKTGVFIFRSENPQAAMARITSFIAEKGYVPSKLETVTESLERIYMKVVNGNA